MKYPFLDLGTLNRPYAQRLKEAADAVIDSGRYIGGAEVQAFEEELAQATGTAYAVGVSNGLDALRLIFKAYIELGRIAPGDEVIVPANTYIASVLAVTDAGLCPVLVEPDPISMNIDSSRIEAAVTPRTRAILTVHLYGKAAYDETMTQTAQRHGMLIVEDNAQAIGADAAVAAPSGSTRTGALGDAAAFSFYPTKNIGALGDAGAVTTDDAALAAAVRALANYGSDRRYHNIYQGYNCRMDPIQAAFLRIKLRDMDTVTAARRRLARIYSESITNPLITKPQHAHPDRDVWHQYVIRTPERDRLAAYLAGNGVGTDIHYATPPHRQPCYSELPGTDSYPITDTIARTVLSIPVSACTSPDDARAISQIINDFR